MFLADSSDANVSARMFFADKHAEQITRLPNFPKNIKLLFFNPTCLYFLYFVANQTHLPHGLRSFSCPGDHNKSKEHKYKLRSKNLVLWVFAVLHMVLASSSSKLWSSSVTPWTEFAIGERCWWTPKPETITFFLFHSLVHSFIHSTFI